MCFSGTCCNNSGFCSRSVRYRCLACAAPPFIIQFSMSRNWRSKMILPMLANKTEEEKMASATAAAIDKRIDLTPLVQGMRECTLMVKEGETPLLSVDTGTNRFTAQLSLSDMNRMNLVLSDSTLTADEKKERISGIIGNIALNAQLSQDYRQGISQQSQSENISIR